VTGMDDDASIRAIFFSECEEQIAALDLGLRKFSEKDFDAETINSVFRAVHSIKGGAGIFGFEAVVEFAHVFESVLELVRGGDLEIDDRIVTVLYAAMDALSDLVYRAENTVQNDAVLHFPVTDELRALATSVEPVETADDFVFEPVALDFAAFDEPSSDETEQSGQEPPKTSWIITFSPRKSFYDRGNDASHILAALRTLGDYSVRLDSTKLPDLGTLDPHDGWLSWSIILDTTATEAALWDVFDWVSEDASITITAQSAAPVPLAVQTPQPLPHKIETARPEAPTQPTPRLSPTIRVDLARVDGLINLVGELVIGQAALKDSLQKLGSTDTAAIRDSIDTLGRLTRDLQDGVMNVRAQPIQTVFQRLDRLVRETAASLGKDVRLVIHGSETEVDRSIIEQLSEPLTHMLRNSLDHGIETPQQRQAADKDPCGTIHISACHRSGRVVIEIRDDGAGINRAKVRQIAEAKHLIEKDASLSDIELDALIFLPGFSTTDHVTDLSGRGVGMDVVKRAITALGGRVSVTSRAHRGTHFIISLPLTLAVLEGMAISVAGHVLIVPMTSIIETLRPAAHALSQVLDRRTVLSLRGTYVPVLDIGVLLNFRAHETDPTQSVAIIVEMEDGTRVGLFADSIINNMQVVIKSIEQNYRKVAGISAATIMGDGKVALILDLEALCRMSLARSTIHSLDTLAGNA